MSRARTQNSAHREPSRRDCARRLHGARPPSEPDPTNGSQGLPCDIQAYRTCENDKVVSSRFVTRRSKSSTGRSRRAQPSIDDQHKDALSHNGAGASCESTRRSPGSTGRYVESSSDARERGDKVIVQIRTLASRTTAVQRARGAFPPTGSCAGPENDGLRRDDARPRGIHGGAGDPPDAAQRLSPTTDRWPSPERPRRGFGGHRILASSVTRCTRHRQAREARYLKGIGAKEIVVSARAISRRAGRRRRRGRAQSTTWVAICSPGCCRRPARRDVAAVGSLRHEAQNDGGASSCGVHLLGADSANTRWRCARRSGPARRRVAADGCRPGAQHRLRELPSTSSLSEGHCARTAGFASGRIRTHEAAIGQRRWAIGAGEMRASEVFPPADLRSPVAAHRLIRSIHDGTLSRSPPALARRP